MASHGRSTPRSTSRSKRRSATNLSELRLQPLSTRFAEPPEEATATKSPQSSYEPRSDGTFLRQHSSYIQGKSAPTSPGILSRSSSRKHLGGGLSRRGSLYDDDLEYKYGAARHGETGDRAEVGSGQIPKAKSEAALLLQQRLSGHGVPRKKQGFPRSHKGTYSPSTKSARRHADEEDWLDRTRAATHEILQEAKGQTWLASRDSSTTLTHLESDEDEADEGYEEMAALSASRARLEDASSPTAARVRSPMWGSRYGSRSVSRRTSRRGSVTGGRTPLALTTVSGDDVASYFPSESALQPDFVDAGPDDETDDADAEEEVARLSDKGSYGLGGIVDRLMSFNLFSVVEHEETTDDDSRGNETEDEANERRAVEAKRKFAEQEKGLSASPAPGGEGDEGQPGGWQEDAAWLFDVASKALF